MLSEKEIEQIRLDSDKYIEKVQVSSASFDIVRDRNIRLGYIAGRTEERESAKALVESAKEMARCAAVFKKNMLSSPVTFNEYISAHESLKEALSNYNKK